MAVLLESRLNRWTIYGKWIIEAKVIGKPVKLLKSVSRLVAKLFMKTVTSSLRHETLIH